CSLSSRHLPAAGHYRDGFPSRPQPAVAGAPYTCAVTSEEPAGILRRVFGYDSFRGDQREIIDHLIGGGDALVLMPTGGGKSLCYQIPAMIRPGTGVVVSAPRAHARSGRPASRHPPSGPGHSTPPRTPPA